MLRCKKLADANIEYRGYLPNLFSPQVYAESMVSVHIPRRQYANGLAGIPTIRVFEALACGIPLVCSPWRDEENLFRPGARLPGGAAMARRWRRSCGIFCAMRRRVTSSLKMD